MQEQQELQEKQSKHSGPISLPYSTGKEDYDQCTKHQIMIEELQELLGKKSKNLGLVLSRCHSPRQKYYNQRIKQQVMMQDLQELLEKKSKDSGTVWLPYSTGKED